MPPFSDPPYPFNCMRCLERRATTFERYQTITEDESAAKHLILFEVKKGEDIALRFTSCDRRNTFEYFEDQTLSLTQKLGKRGGFAQVSGYEH